MGFDPPARLEDADFPQMRVFGDHPAEIIPHSSDNALGLGIREPGKSAVEVEPGALRNAEMRADAASQPAADRRGPIERKQAKSAKEHHCAKGLQPMSELR